MPWNPALVAKAFFGVVVLLSIRGAYRRRVDGRCMGGRLLVAAYDQDPMK
jgi:hypothetical protein